MRRREGIVEVLMRATGREDALGLVKAGKVHS
jgi:hypothetical protein